MQDVKHVSRSKRTRRNIDESVSSRLPAWSVRSAALRASPWLCVEVFEIMLAFQRASCFLTPCMTFRLVRAQPIISAMTGGAPE